MSSVESEESAYRSLDDSLTSSTVGTRQLLTSCSVDASSI